MNQSADADPPVPENSLEERELILERTVEVLRQELISQNKKIGRLETLALAQLPH